MRVCCIRSFGHFVARLQGSVLQFSPAAGIFVSTARSEQDGLLPQAQAQLRMVSGAPLPGWGAVTAAPAGARPGLSGNVRARPPCGDPHAAGAPRTCHQ